MSTRTLAHFRTGIGNFICMTPALQALASMDPSGKVDLCTDHDWIDSRRDGMLDLWRRLPFVENIYIVDFTDSANIRFEKNYSVWYYAEWATHGEARAFFEKRKPYPKKEWNHNLVHETDYYFATVRDYYGYSGPKPDQMVMPADSPVLPKADKKRVALCNGSFGDQAIAKKWDRFPELAAELRNYFEGKIEIVKIGNCHELSDVAVYDQDFVGKLSFAETAKVIDQCDLMITTDTGLMHAGDALKKPMLVLWGGSALEKNKPISGNAHIIHLGKKCSPCFRSEGYKECEGHTCITGITINEVMFHVRRMLNVGN